MLLFFSFEQLHQIFEDDTTFNRFDDYSFSYKFLARFGAASGSLVFAQSLCYPLDLLKRRI